MTLSPLRALILRKLLKINRSYREVSERTWVLSAAESRISPPAFYREEDLARVTATMGDTNIAYEMSRIRGGRSEHGATVAYELRDVHLIDGALYKGAMMKQLVRRPRRYMARDVPVTTGPVALVGTFYGSVYFGHWITDDLTLQLAAESLAPPFIADRPSYGHEPGYCKLLGIDQHRLSDARFDRLIMLDDVGQNAYKRRRYAELRDRLQKSAPSSGSELVYIRRGSAGARERRSLMNIEAVESYLESQGFVIVDPDRLSAAEIAASIVGASVVVGVEGSHMAHAIYAVREGGALCMMQPPYRFNNVFKDYADCLAFAYSFTVGTEVSGGFTVDLGDLERVITKVRTGGA